MHVYMYVQASTYTHSSTCMRHFVSQSSKNRNHIIFVFVLQVNGVTKFAIVHEKRLLSIHSCHYYHVLYMHWTKSSILVRVHKRQLIKMVHECVCVKAYVATPDLTPRAQGSEHSRTL